MDELIYALFKFCFWVIKAMFQLMAIMLVLVVALYGWLGLGLAWLVMPDKPAITRSTRKFNRWLNRTFRAIR